MRTKKFVALIILAAFMMTMTACSGNAEEEQDGTGLTAVEEDAAEGGSIDVETDGNADAEADDLGIAEEESEASAGDATVLYTGESFSKSAFAAGGTVLYLCGMRDGEYFFGCMEQEGDTFEEFSLDVGDGMRVNSMYVDEENRCHMLWFDTETVTVNGQEFASVSFEKSCIMVIDSSGTLLEQIDTTDFFSSEQTIPYSFAVDHKGNYWFEEGTYLVSLSPDGTLNQKIECPGTVETVGVGASGMVYAVYQAEGSRYLGCIFNDGDFAFECSLPDTGSAFSQIAPGADGVDVLFYHLSEGVYGYDRNTMKHLVSADELPVTGENVNGYGILSDGRLCLMGAEEDGVRAFYYLKTHCADFVTFMR